MPKDILAHVDRLRTRHRGRYHVPFPDLSLDRDPAPSGPCFAPIVPRGRGRAAPAGLIVSHLHKSSYQVLSRTEVQFASRKV